MVNDHGGLSCRLRLNNGGTSRFIRLRRRRRKVNDAAAGEW